MMRPPSLVRSHAAAAILLSLVAARPHAAWAQPPGDRAAPDTVPSQPPAARLRTALAGTVPGTEVRLIAGARPFPHPIAFQAVEGDTLVLRAPRLRRERVALADVESLELQRGSQAGRGALIGGGVGGAAFGVFSALVVQGFCGNSSGCGGAAGTGFLLGAVSGGAVGALVGAGIGATVPRWRRVFP